MLVKKFKPLERVLSLGAKRSIEIKRRNSKEKICLPKAKNSIIIQDNFIRKC